MRILGSSRKPPAFELRSTALIVPTELQADVDGMKDANSRIRSGWSGYVTYLIEVGDDEDVHFDLKLASPHIRTVAKGWYDFKKAHGAVNKLLKAKLE